MHTDSGQIVGDYKVIEHIGTGAVGKVYKVEHAVTKRLEAMKVLNSGYAAGSEPLLRFEREIRLQASLKHKNICQVYNAFLVDADLVMVMELVEGWTLQRRLDHGRLTLAESIGILRQILAALEHAHGHEILHRDLKPANVLLASDGTVKLTDFGLAIEPKDPQLTEQGTPVGTFYYISPELIKGVRPLTAATDIYSAGVLFYEMITGRRPFEQTEAFDLMTAHVKQTPPRPRSIDDSIPAGIEKVVLKALAKKPGDRYASATEFLAALDVAASARPTEDEETGERIAEPIDWSRYTGWLTSGKTWFALGSSMAVVMAALAWAAWHPTAAVEPQPVPPAASVAKEVVPEAAKPEAGKPAPAVVEPPAVVAAPVTTAGPAQIRPYGGDAPKRAVRSSAAAARKKTAPAPVARVHGMDSDTGAPSDLASASPGPLAPPPLPRAVETPTAASVAATPPPVVTPKGEAEVAPPVVVGEKADGKKREPVFKKLRVLNPFRRRPAAGATNANGSKDPAPNP